MGGKREVRSSDKMRDLDGTKEKGRPENEYQLLEDGSFIHVFVHSSLKRLLSECLLQIYNLGTWEAEGGGCKNVQDLSGLHSKFKSGLSNLESRSKL